MTGTKNALAPRTETRWSEILQKAQNDANILSPDRLVDCVKRNEGDFREWLKGLEPLDLQGLARVEEMDESDGQDGGHDLRDKEDSVS